MRPANRQRGVALALLLVLLAGLSLLLLSTLETARLDVRMTQSRVDRSQAYYLMRGYANVVMRDFAAVAANVPAGDPSAAGIAPARLPFERQYREGDWTLTATLYPASAMVSLSDADTALLQAVLQAVGGLNERTAQVLAERIDGVRSGKQRMGLSAGNSAPRRFEVIEDALSLGEMPRSVYERISPFIRVDGVPVPDAATAPRQLVEALARLGGSASARWGEALRDRSETPAAGATAPVPPANLGGEWEVFMSARKNDARGGYRLRIAMRLAPSAGRSWSPVRVYPIEAAAGPRLG